MIEFYENDPNLDKHLRELIDIAVDIIDEFKKKSGWEGLFVTHTVEEWLWGYEDELLKLLHDVVPQYVPTSVFGLSVSPFRRVRALLCISLVSRRLRPPPRQKNVWCSKQTFLSQTPRLLIINLICDCNWSLYIRYISNFHHQTDQ